MSFFYQINVALMQYFFQKHKKLTCNIKNAHTNKICFCVGLDCGLVKSHIVKNTRAGVYMLPFGCGHIIPSTWHLNQVPWPNSLGSCASGVMSLQSMWIASRKYDMGFNHLFSIARINKKKPQSDLEMGIWWAYCNVFSENRRVKHCTAVSGGHWLCPI